MSPELLTATTAPCNAACPAGVNVQAYVGLISQERFQEAAASYRRALEFDPGDLDAKRNLELSLRRAQEQQQQQQPGEQQQESGDDDQDSRQQQQQQQQEQQQDQEGQQDRPRPDPGEERQDGTDDQASPQPDDGGDPGDRQPDRSGERGSMSREEAERLLDGLEGEERENLRRLAAREANAEVVRREKDW